MKTIYLASGTRPEDIGDHLWHTRADMLLGAYFHIVDPIDDGWVPDAIAELEQGDIIDQCDIILTRFDNPDLYKWSNERCVIVFGMCPPWYVKLMQMFPIPMRLYETLEQAAAYLIKRHGTNVV